jgi:glyoxylase-like metal-dependent hydrolase (beta-lactamase superfamily II)
MAQYRITSLRVGELYVPHGGSIMRDPIHCWLVRGGGRNILVDTGMTDIPPILARLKVSGVGAVMRASPPRWRVRG